MSGIRLEVQGIWPALTCNNLQQSIDFYTGGLGFEIVDRNEHEGVLRFVMLKAGTGQLGLGQDDGAKGMDRVKGVGLRFWAETNQDIHALAAQARAAGITLDGEVQALPWGPLAFQVTDPDGFKLTISAPR